MAGRKVAGMGGSVGGAEDGGAGKAGVEAGHRRGDRAVSAAAGADGAAGDLVRITADLGVAEGARSNARLQRSEGLGEAVGIGSVVGEVRARPQESGRISIGDGHERRSERSAADR